MKKHVLNESERKPAKVLLYVQDKDFQDLIVWQMVILCS